MAELITTLGPKRRDALGMILPHEHVFVDLRTPDTPGYAEANPLDVVRVMAPELVRIRALGVTALVECSTGGVGRRPDCDYAVSLATGLPIVVPTGNYREPWIPDWVATASEDDLYAWMRRELEVEIDGAPFRAGWIKVSAGDDGITELETRILRAAARAGAATNAVIGSHTIRGRVVMDQLDIIEDAGYTPERFISIHTQEEPNFDMHLQVAERGAWIEYDHIGRADNEDVVAMILRVLEAGYGHRLLLSHDRGWYDPAQPDGGTPAPYTVLSEEILPMLRARGVDEVAITRLTHTNPFDAFAR